MLHEKQRASLNGLIVRLNMTRTSSWRYIKRLTEQGRGGEDESKNCKTTKGVAKLLGTQ